MQNENLKVAPLTSEEIFWTTHVSTCFVKGRFDIESRHAPGWYRRRAGNTLPVAAGTGLRALRALGAVLGRRVLITGNQQSGAKFLLKSLAQPVTGRWLSLHETVWYRQTSLPEVYHAG